MAEKHLYEIKHIETSFRTDGKMFKAIEDVYLYLKVAVSSLQHLQ